MKAVQTSLVFLSLACSALGWISRLVNQTNLETKYTDYCGRNSLCSMRNSSTENNSEIKFPMFCPPCSCSPDCEMSGQCCPDKSLSTCIQPTYSFNEEIHQSATYLMVSRCPQAVGQSGDDCFLNLEPNNFQHLAPVFSSKTRITYLNSKCSKCHGEDEVIEWTYSLSCQGSNMNLNTYSDVEELMKDVKEQRCIIEFYPQNGMFPVECMKENMISECNHTGEWDIYDEDIATACNDLWNPYGLFQNVFCFLCNTNVNQRNVFKMNFQEERTGDTGSIVTDACSENCDGFSSPSNDDILIYKDMNVSFSEAYHIKEQIYMANLITLSWDVVENIRNFVKAEDVKIKNNTESQEDNFNLTALYEEYVMTGAYQNWCQNDFQVNKIYTGIKSKRMCSCENNCYLSSTCCPDIAYHHSMACVYPFLGSTDTKETQTTNSIFLISRCPVNYTNHSVKRMCENTTDFEIFTVPVINVNTSKSYKNHFCYLCQNHEDIENDAINDTIVAFNMTLKCPTIIYPKFVPSMKSLLKIAKQSRCSITFFTAHRTETCFSDMNDSSKIKNCNFTGLLKSVSNHSRKLCEDPLITVMAKSRNRLYKNEICDMCNSEVFEDAVGVCVVDPYDTRLPLLCEHGMLDIQYYPYKNNFCQRCGQKFVLDPTTPPIWGLPSYRQLFSILDTRTDKIFKKVDCKENEFYDAYKSECRKLYCSPGKFVQDSSCKHFIPFVESKYVPVLYNMVFKVSITSLTPDAYSVLNNFETFFRQIYGNSQIQEYYAFVGKSCSSLKSVPVNMTSKEEALVYVKFTLKSLEFDLLNKSALEEDFVNFDKVTLSIEGTLLTLEKSVESEYFPTLHLHGQQLLKSKSCLIKHIAYTENIHAFDVNELLMCTQIQLKPDEFKEETTRVYVPAVNKYFDAYEFYKSNNGTIRICSNSYKLVSNIKLPSTSEKVLSVLTYLSTVLSLLSLLSTFLTFCLLPFLRTLPGKNMMCYVFSLFFAQLLFLLRSHGELFSQSVCAFLGGLTHYFWLAVFMCSNVCSFHMFRLFVSSSLVNSGENEVSHLLRNIFVAFLIPILPVGINIILSYTVNSVQFGYGGAVCFLTSPLALLLTVLLPVIIQILFNLIMFSITFHYIRKTPKVESSHERNEFSIFLKLFLLTGISWILLVIDGFFEMSLFTFLATVVNGSQGVFLFISYVLNKRILQALKNKIAGKPTKTLSSTRDTSLLSRSDGFSSNEHNPRKGRNATQTSRI